MAADDLMTQRDRSSALVVLTKFFQNIPVSIRVAHLLRGKRKIIWKTVLWNEKGSLKNLYSFISNHLSIDKIYSDCSSGLMPSGNKPLPHWTLTRTLNAISLWFLPLCPKAEGLLSLPASVRLCVCLSIHPSVHQSVHPEGQTVWPSLSTQ